MAAPHAGVGPGVLAEAAPCADPRGGG